MQLQHNCTIKANSIKKLNIVTVVGQRLGKYQELTKKTEGNSFKTKQYADQYQC